MVNDRMPRTLCWVLYVVLMYEIEGAPLRNFDFVLTKFDCIRFDTVMSHFNCSHYQIKPNFFMVGIESIFSQDIHNSYNFQTTIDVLLKNARKPYTVFDVRINVCDGLEALLSNPLSKTIFSEYRRTTNIPSSCPLKANQIYKTENYTVTDKFFPIYTPDCEFNLTGTYIYKEATIAKLLVSGKVTTTRSNNKINIRKN